MQQQVNVFIIFFSSSLFFLLYFPSFKFILLVLMHQILQKLTFKSCYPSLFSPFIYLYFFIFSVKSLLDKMHYVLFFFNVVISIITSSVIELDSRLSFPMTIVIFPKFMLF